MSIEQRRSETVQLSELQ